MGNSGAPCRRPGHREGSWLRCALHAHTARSDGELGPRDLAAHYARAGYDVLAITDHWRITGDDSVDGITVLPGVELNCILPGARDGHVLGYGVSASDDELHALAKEHADLADVASWIGGHGGIPYLAHPYWTGVTPGTLELPDDVVGIEIFNAGCELEVGRGLSAVHWDELLEAGRLCPALATDDSHHPGYDSDLAWTWVKARGPIARGRAGRAARRRVLRIDRAADRDRSRWKTVRWTCAAARAARWCSSRDGRPAPLCTPAGSGTGTAGRSSSATRAGS